MNNRELLAKAHNPAEVEKDGMVYEVYEDGEITLQKSGRLYGQRNLHQQAGPAIPQTWHSPEHPQKAAVATREEAYALRQSILAWWAEYQTEMNAIWTKPRKVENCGGIV